MTAQISIDVYHQLFIKSRTAIELRFAVRSQFRMPIMSGGGFYPKESSPGAHLLVGSALSLESYPIERREMAYASKTPPLVWHFRTATELRNELRNRQKYFGIFSSQAKIFGNWARGKMNYFYFFCPKQ